MTFAHALDHLLHQHLRYLTATPAQHDVAEASFKAARQDVEAFAPALPVRDDMAASLTREIVGMKAGA